MPRPICVACQVEMRCIKNDFYAVLMANEPPEPYQIWASDKWACPKCGIEILTGFAQKPVAESWQEAFANWPWR